ncbi:Formyltransferase [Clathrospora elynae]|uniref:methionyl-tRNA formyltransferase n=1 Tax=Clathrospora elynae TaxID=706981 RepID=A0A6A5T1Z7_9PLEO|nr:Formyltransferase [Clathrospora elynae]
MLSPYRRCSSMIASPRASKPLQILFCGSDGFSIASLRALVEARRDAPTLIDSIDVVHRPAKPTGRGLKTLRELPIKQVAAEELKLPTHAIDTFTDWIPPVSINLVIAVSFGLLVPPRILDHAKYGGLNVHPSLLPDLRGPAPIEHAILKTREYTGVSIQTLHPNKFDRGTILAQTPAPGIAIPRSITASQLEQQLAKEGADMLVEVLKSRKFVPPLENAAWYASSKGPIHYAPKITKQDRFIDFSKATLDHVLAIQHALGDAWCILPNGDRLILHRVVDSGMADAEHHEPGLFFGPTAKEPMFRAACGRIGILMKSTYEGNKQGHGNAKLWRMLDSQDAYASQG